MFTFVYLPEKVRPIKINNLAKNVPIFVYFCIPFTLGRRGFVWNQWVDRHGSVTNVVKTPRNVVKSVVISVVETWVRRYYAMYKPLPAERGEGRMRLSGEWA